MLAVDGCCWLGAGPPRTSRTPGPSAPLGAAVLAHPGRRVGPRLLRSVPMETGGKLQMWGNVPRPSRGHSERWAGGCVAPPGTAWQRAAPRRRGARNGAGPAAPVPGPRSSQLQPCHRCELRRRAAKAHFYFSSCFLFSDLTAACPAGRQSLSAAGLARLWVGSADALAACY